MAKLLDTVTVLALVASLFIGGRIMLERAGDRAAERDREIADWESLAAEGQRMGPMDAPVVILEWGDYQCPGCRSIAPLLADLRGQYPNDLAVVYRHWPLSNHPFAFQAARAAECAAQQGAFERVHEALNRESDWASAPDGDSISGLMELASRAGVPDASVLRVCISSGDPDERINRDTETVRALETRGTPTLVINGVYSASALTSEDLRRRVAEAVASSTRREGP